MASCAPGGGGSRSCRGWRPGWQPTITRSRGPPDNGQNAVLDRKYHSTFQVSVMSGHLMKQEERFGKEMSLKYQRMMISWIGWHQRSCSQTIRMTICFRWWKISWRLWQRQTGLTTIYCLLLCLWNMFWMWQGMERQSEREGGGH